MVEKDICVGGTFIFSRLITGGYAGGGFGQCPRCSSHFFVSGKATRAFCEAEEVVRVCSTELSLCLSNFSSSIRCGFLVLFIG